MPCDHGNNKQITTPTATNEPQCHLSHVKVEPLQVFAGNINCLSSKFNKFDQPHASLNSQSTLTPSSVTKGNFNQSREDSVSKPKTRFDLLDETMPLLPSSSKNFQSISRGNYSNMGNIDQSIDVNIEGDQGNHEENEEIYRTRSTDHIINCDNTCQCEPTFQDQLLHFFINLLVMTVCTSSLLALIFSLWLIFYVCIKIM